MIVLRTLGRLDLRDDAGDGAHRVLAQPKRFALLAYLAITSVPQHRDTLLALFWPELDSDRARLALRQAVHFLRSALGREVVRGHNGDGLVVGQLQCDASEFGRAVDEGRLADALALYRGDLLTGFHFGNASSEFDQWLEHERCRFRTRAAEAAGKLADAAERAGNNVDASNLARQAMQLAGDDETGLRRVIGLLDRLGDRAGALRTYEDFAHRLRKELEVDPGIETRRLIDAVRSHGADSAPALPPATPTRSQPLALAPSAARTTSVRSGWMIAAMLLVATVVGGFLSRSWTGTSRAPPNQRVAQRFYGEGLRAYNRGEWRGAHRLFMTALAEDSTFAMAAYYAARSVRWFRVDSEFVLLKHAARMADRAPERDRFVIKVAQHLFDPPAQVAAVAESLASRYPDEPDGYLAMARIRVAAGDFAGAVPYARRVIALDGEGLEGPTPLCRACDGYALLLGAYAALGSDSFPAVERVSREWIHRQPTSATAWDMLAKALAWRGRREEAIQALNRAAQLQPYMMPRAMFERAVFQGESYVEAERLLRDRLRFDDRDYEAIWWLATALRHQGRMTEALAILRQAPAHPSSVEAGALAAAEAQIRFELGDFSEAARRFEALMRRGFDDPGDTGYAAHRITWVGTHAARAWAAAGDTVRLSLLADSVARVAHLSTAGVDRRLPHYLRGLRWQARGQPERAVEEFRASIYSVTLGYTGTNLDLARSLMTIGRVAEAVRLLREVLAVSPDGLAYYVTRTEVHDGLARAFDAAGQPDSAAMHYRLVAQAWSEGDPPYRARSEVARERLLAISHLHPSVHSDLKVR